MSIAVSTNKDVFLFSTNSTSYAFGVDDQGLLRHLYWGGKLGSAEELEVPPLTEVSTNDPVYEITREEFPVHGGLRYKDHCLKATFADGSLGGYRLLVVPQMIIAKPEFQEKLRAFVRGGGTAVLTYRDFVKDADNNLVFGKQIPLDFDGFTGVCVTETESLQEGQEFPLDGEGALAGAQGRGGIFRDMLEVSDAEVLLRYGDSFYRQFAAVTRKTQERGSVYYLGCGLDEALLARVLEQAASEQNISPVPSEPGVEVVCRGEGENRIRMAINHNPHETRDQGQTLAPFECRITPAN